MILDGRERRELRPAAAWLFFSALGFSLCGGLGRSYDLRCLSQRCVALILQRRRLARESVRAAALLFDLSLQRPFVLVVCGLVCSQFRDSGLRCTEFGLDGVQLPDRIFCPVSLLLELAC
jgi:hypothetical protein